MIIDESLIDKMTDNFIFEVVGHRTNEYMIAEEEARMYKQAGYPPNIYDEEGNLIENNIPLSILTDAQANNRTPQEATDDIISMADQWRALQMKLRAFRLEAKAQIRNSQSEEELRVAMSIFDTRLAELKQLI